jgi:CPA2 family monovalent cation:H+ antiporter-2
MEITAPTIFELGLVLLVAAAAGWLARRLSLPAVVGYLAVGVAVSPFTPGYIANREQVQLLADVGVVLLLFEVGIEIDVPRLRSEHRGLIWTAPLQVGISTAVSAVALVVAGLPPFGAVILGLSVALSSGVVIVNITRSRRRTTDEPTERALLGWSVLQDIAGVAAAAVVLALAGVGNRPADIALLGLLAFAALALGVARALPLVLVRLGGQPDLFLIVSVATGLAVAGAGSVLFGIPLALAAFVAGLAIGESPQAAEARRRLLPFRDLFAVLFFVAVGMLIDPAALARGLGWLALLLGLVVLAKIAVAFALARLARVSARPLQLAVGLGQMGEFGYVLAGLALAAGAVGTEVHAAVLAAVAVSIAISTLAVRLVGHPPTRAGLAD